MAEEKPAKQASSGAMRLAGVGVELAATVGAACLLGYWIDYKFETHGWGMVICALIGIVGGLYNLIRHAVHDMVMPPRQGRRADERSGQTGPDDGKKRADL